MSRLLPLALLLSGCALTRHPVTPAAVQAAAVNDLIDLLSTPGPITHQAITSARWAVPLSGMIDLTDPAAAELTNDKTPIVLPVHVLTHPDAGVFIVDTGVDAGMAEGRGPSRGLVRGFTSNIEVVEPLADILARSQAPLAGVLLTHLHLDHVLGLPDVPPGTPVYIGEGETGARKLEHVVLRRTMRAVLERQAPLRTWPLESAAPLGPVAAAWDVIGDGSLWALSMPGHTPGSTAYLARTTQGPILLTGDTSHTRWGWDHDVTPGTYTADHEANRDSLAQLRALSALVPSMTIYVGHELSQESMAVMSGR
jgi:N-acyl homoserine lactone hydrolase